MHCRTSRTFLSRWHVTDLQMLKEIGLSILENKCWFCKTIFIWRCYRTKNNRSFKLMQLMLLQHFYDKDLLPSNILYVRPRTSRPKYMPNFIFHFCRSITYTVLKSKIHLGRKLSSRYSVMNIINKICRKLQQVEYVDIQDYIY